MCLPPRLSLWKGLLLLINREPGARVNSGGVFQSLVSSLRPCRSCCARPAVGTGLHAHCGLSSGLGGGPPVPTRCSPRRQRPVGAGATSPQVTALPIHRAQPRLSSRESSQQPAEAAAIAHESQMMRRKPSETKAPASHVSGTGPSRQPRFWGQAHRFLQPPQPRGRVRPAPLVGRQSPGEKRRGSSHRWKVPRLGFKPTSLQL